LVAQAGAADRTELVIEARLTPQCNAMPEWALPRTGLADAAPRAAVHGSWQHVVAPMCMQMGALRCAARHTSALRCICTAALRCAALRCTHIRTALHTSARHWHWPGTGTGPALARHWHWPGTGTGTGTGPALARHWHWPGTGPALALARHWH
jgi:hypothetical protein